MNVNRAGVVFVSYGQRSGHDLETITGWLADSALDVYNALLAARVRERPCGRSLTTDGVSNA